MENPLPPPAAPSSGIAADPGRQRATTRRIVWRLIPLLFLCYIVAYIDRINVGFAKLHLREALGVDADRFSSAYGLGAGLFFVGYFLFEVPSNLALQRIGARVWLARIMIVWGLVSTAFMAVNGIAMFHVLRFTLGAAEAGFFPGVILYLTYWFPARERARTVAIFAAGAVLAGVVGAPLSGALLEWHGHAGLAGWQWLFLVEGIPAILMGFVLLAALPNRPRDAAWLTAEEKAWVEGRVAQEAAVAPASHPRLTAVFSDARVWRLCAVYFLLNVGGYGYELWLPTIVSSLSAERAAVVGLISAIPYVAAGVAMIVVAGRSDRTGNRRGVVALAAVVSAAGFAASAATANAWLAMAALTVAFIGLKCTVAPFWAMATTYLGGAAAAAGIAFINSVGNLGGFAGPYLVGVIKDHSRGNVGALLLLGGALLGMALLTPREPSSRRA